MAHSELPSFPVREGDDGLYPCPVNKHHRLTVGRFPLHVLNCAKELKLRNKTQLMQCPFDRSHVWAKVKEDDMLVHLEQCQTVHHSIDTLGEHSVPAEKYNGLISDLRRQFRS